MKIAVIGGASAFTPGIIEGLFAEKAVLGGAEVYLMDIDLGIGRCGVFHQMK